MDFVGQLGNLHRSGVGSIHRSIHYEHALSLSSRRCHLQISAKKKKKKILAFQAWNFTTKRVKQKRCKRFSFGNSDPLCICQNGIFRSEGFCDLHLPLLWDYQGLECRNCPAQPHLGPPLSAYRQVLKPRASATETCTEHF